MLSNQAPMVLRRRSFSARSTWARTGCPAPGDNFLRARAGHALQRFRDLDGGAIFGYRVADPTSYGVVEFDDEGRAISLEEKPEKPRSNYAVPGLYFYSNDVVEMSKSSSPRPVVSWRSPTSPPIPRAGPSAGGGASSRYRMAGHRHLRLTADAGNYVATIENREGLKIGAPEEVAWRRGFLSDDELRERAEPLVKSGYGAYLFDLLGG